VTRPRFWNELLADDDAALGPVAEAHPDLAPEALGALLQEAAAGLVALEEVVGAAPAEPIRFRALQVTVNRLARARREAQGLRRCISHPNCYRDPSPVVRGLATLWLCEECAKLPW